MINGPLVVPSLEDSFQCNGHTPEGRQPDFSAPRDIASASTIAEDYIVHLVGAIVANGMQRKWAQIYDHSGAPRFAIQIPQATASSLSPGDDASYIAALEHLQQRVLTRIHINIGLILTPVEDAA